MSNPNISNRFVAHAILIFALAAPSYAAIVLAPIDEFTDASQPAPEWERVADLRITANPWNQSSSIRVSSVGSGYLVVGNGAGVVSETLVDYTASAGAVNLTAGGADGISIGLGLADVAGDFTTTVYDASGRFATSTITTNESIRSYTELDFLFADFNGASGVDMTSISRVSLSYLPSRDGADLLVDYISTSQINPPAVPEPSALGLMFTGLAACAWRRRRSPRPTRFSPTNSPSV